MRGFWIIVGAVLLTGVANAQSVSAPALREGDRWGYLHTSEDRTGWHQIHAELTVTRVSAASVGISEKTVNSPNSPRDSVTNSDWSRSRNVNGKMTTVNKPLAFPLSVGKVWDVDFTEQNPNRTHSSEHFHYPYKVVGWEDVTVPAGTFHALKIESEGEWSAVMAPSVTAATGARTDAYGSTAVAQTSRVGATAITGRGYRVIWYVPAIKRWVKVVEDLYSTNGTRSDHQQDELESWQSGG